MERNDRIEISKWRNHALEAAANIVQTYIDKAGAEAAAGAVDDILSLRDNLPAPDGWVTLNLAGAPATVHPYPKPPTSTPFVWRAYRLGETWRDN